MIHYSARALNAITLSVLLAGGFFLAGCSNMDSLNNNEKPMAELKNTYWKLIELNAKAITMAPEQQRKIRITLASEGDRVHGFSGCNQLMGGYVLNGNSLYFSQMAGTLMACASPMMEIEQQVLKALAATKSFRINSEHLSLLDGNNTVARFEAVYLR